MSFNELWNKYSVRTTIQGWPGNTGGGEFPAVITVLENTLNFAKVGNTGKYEILELFFC